MASRLTAQQIRKQARQRAVEASAKHENLARERFEAELAEQRARAKANEDNLRSYLAAEAAIAEAEEQLATTKQASILAMSDAVQAIVAREGSVVAAATLLGVKASRISSLAKATTARHTSTDESGIGKQRLPSPVCDGSDGAEGGASSADVRSEAAPAELSA